ncbi:MAG: hypothetical protein KIS67_21810 [Verrucomicrobiae bacterium]|nr:hypothetical protein [Verrucomicrobiae bacterium]
MLQSTKGAAFECALLANEALKHYVSIHNRIFSEQATVTSFFRNLFGRGTNFEALLNEARSADQLWQNVDTHVAGCFGAFRDDFTQAERDFFVELLAWVKAVKKTTALLCERQEALIRKANGESLSMSDYQQIERDYERAVESYVRLGSSVQEKMEKLSSASY